MAALAFLPFLDLRADACVEERALGMYRPPNPGPKPPPPPRDELGESDEGEAEAAWKRGPVCDEREKGMGWAVGVFGGAVGGIDRLAEQACWTRTSLPIIFPTSPVPCTKPDSASAPNEDEATTSSGGGWTRFGCEILLSATSAVYELACLRASAFPSKAASGSQGACAGQVRWGRSNRLG